MEAKELMIYDWVMFKESKHPYQVLTTSYMNVVLPSTGGPLTSNMEPIPLTEEILKANGFGKSDKYMLWYFKHKDFPYYEIHIEDRLACSDFKLQHVHELQHALRLCGWEELADNFKIE